MLGLPSTAAAFQAAGVTALIFDPLGVGESDGHPRNDISPFHEVDDMSDALTYLSSHPIVDPRQGVGFWGMSLGGSVALSAATVDPRASFVVAVCPMIHITFDMKKLYPLLAKAAKDRESRIEGKEPYYVPVVLKNGENPGGFDPGWEREALMRAYSLRDENGPRPSMSPGHVKRTTVGTYRNLLMWRPQYMWKHLRQPILFIIPENDQLNDMATQVREFENLPEPKRMHIQQGAAHVDILEGKNQDQVNRIQVEFLRDALQGRV
jgi:pimeloyl-ACP methyl ester carboxylesterase